MKVDDGVWGDNSTYIVDDVFFQKIQVGTMQKYKNSNNR